MWKTKHNIVVVIIAVITARIFWLIVQFSHVYFLGFLKVLPWEIARVTFAVFSILDVIVDAQTTMLDNSNAVSASLIMLLLPDAVWHCGFIVVETENEADKAKAPMLNFAPSKWETVDESELEAQGDWALCLFYLLLVLVTKCRRVYSDVGRW